MTHNELKIGDVFIAVSVFHGVISLSYKVSESDYKDILYFKSPFLIYEGRIFNSFNDITHSFSFLSASIVLNLNLTINFFNNKSLQEINDYIVKEFPEYAI